MAPYYLLPLCEIWTPSGQLPLEERRVAAGDCPTSSCREYRRGREVGPLDAGPKASMEI